MNVTLCSAFRNATPYVLRCMEQFARLGNLLDGRLHLVLCEGDSSDETHAALLELTPIPIKYGCYTADIFQHHHGGPDHGSVVNAERFANLAKVWNAIWSRIPSDSDAILFCESDLTWSPETMLALLDRLADYPAISPMVMLKREGWHPDFFYDGWAARKNGRHISPMPPYFNGWDMESPVQVDSMGSCMAIRGDLARQLTWPAEDVCVGLSRIIYEHGGAVYLDPTQKVVHP